MGAERVVVAVYGTLRRGERNHFLLESAEFLGTGSVTGTLYDVPRTPYRPYAYPALLPEGDGHVLVELFRLPDGAALEALDELERFVPDDEAASQYLRRHVAVIDGRIASAHVYFYAAERGELGEVIASGDWVTYAGKTSANARPT